MLRILVLLVWAAALYAVALRAAEAPLYYLLWFDTEDYIEPASDDAALRLALDLEKAGVRAMFKVVGEKARVLESRGRRDVIRALARHDIGYHTNYHSIPPAPSMYLRSLGLLEGAAEFERRELPGVRDLQRIFGVTPSCFGQPGSSWGPQSNIALRKMGIPVYMDEGSHLGYDDQPFWYMGVLHMFHLGQYSMRADINDPAKLPEATKRFDEAVARLKAKGGGFIHTYYHPTEFVTTEFWDAANFARGKYTAPADYKRPQLRTAQSSEQTYRILMEYVAHIKKSGVKFVTARDLPQLIDSPHSLVDVTEIRGKMLRSIDVVGPHSAADQLLALLGFQSLEVDGPAARLESTLTATSISKELFDKGREEAIGYIETHLRLPAAVWFGSERLSLADFAATLAGDHGGSTVAVRKGTLAFEKYVAADPKRTFDWAIHPEGFSAPELLEMGRLQAWTLKPARMR